MPSAGRCLGQALLYALFFVPLVYLTQAPNHHPMPPDMAVLKVAVRHAGNIIGECTALAGPDIGNRPANMQRAEICPRERSPLRLELIVDGETLYRATVQASGLHNDGVSSMYQRFTIPAGHHQLELLMNDDQSVDGYNWQLQQAVDLKPAQVMVASFKEGFRLQ